MARKPRIHRPSAFYHVMLRGNNKGQIFFSNQDRIQLCLLIQEGIERFGHRIHSFCFMHNHIHLVIQPADVSLSKIIHHLAFRYTRYINRKEDRVGHLFQGRFKAILVDAENYLSELMRYIHLNPVRAGLVVFPEEYLWSSHRAYLNLEAIPWLTKEWILHKFSTQKSLAEKLYGDYIKKGLGEKSRSEFYTGTHNGNVLGSEDFAQEALNDAFVRKETKINCSLDGLLHAVSCVLKLPIDTFKRKERTYTQARGIVAYLVKNTSNITLNELAAYFDHDSSRTSRLATKIQQELYSNSDLANQVEQVKLILNNPFQQNAKAQA